MKPTTSYLMYFLIFLAYVLYLLGLYQACVVSVNGGTVIRPEDLATAVTTIATIFSTNLGAVMGLTIGKQTSKFKDYKTWNPLTIFKDPSTEILQVITCYFYILSLVLVALFWWVKLDARTTEIVPLVAELSKSLLGIILGALAVALNTQNHKP